MGDIVPQYEVGHRIGNYALLRRVGRWVEHPCRVYLAEQTVLGRRAEIRLLMESDPELVDEWRETARLMARFDHPNIPTLYDIGGHQGHPYLVLQYVEGRSLYSLLKAKAQMSLHAVLRMMATVAGSLAHAHSKGAVHRNVRPENILLGPTGEAVVSGFWGPVPSPGAARTRISAFLGSPYYASPEQARGEADSVGSNVWNFGAMLFHVLAGQRPHEGENFEDVLRETASPEPVDLSPLGPRAPEYVVSIIDRCLRKRPGERFASADEARRALETAVDHMEASEGATVILPVPGRGQTLLLHVEHEEAEFPGAYREYEIGERIGGGAFGDVFRARDRLSGRDLAIKILRREWLADAEAVARFRREAALLSRLSHPNVVGVHNFGRYGASFFTAMELLGGKTLEDVIAARAPIDPEEAASFMDPVLSGLAAVHEAGAVHRDLKPANIEVTPGRVVLFDFGMAHVRDSAKLTMSGVFVGTPEYTPPPRRRPGLPRGLSAVLDRMLEKDPAARPTATEARRLIAEAAAG
jgi:serine/threonine protein kinase